MKTFEIHIKNMVCDRCIIYVTQALVELNLLPIHVTLGFAKFTATNEDALSDLTKKLNSAGLYIISDKTELTIEKIKIAIIKYLNEVISGKRLTKLSQYVADQLAKNYFSLSKLFSTHENITIEAYTIRQKVEMVKQMLRENELTLSEIAYKLKYTNVQHLSNQFKHITGRSVSDFRNEYHFFSTSNEEKINLNTDVHAQRV